MTDDDTQRMLSKPPQAGPQESLRFTPIRTDAAIKAAAAVGDRKATTEQRAQAVILPVEDEFKRAALAGDFSMRDQAKTSKLFKIVEQPGAFRDCRMKYAYDNKQDIYSVSVTLNNQPMVVTVRTGGAFTELSLSDRQGNVVEMWRQEEGKGVSVYRRE
ncbi:Uncharacterised protein [Candidatus Bilamarchaeum dharawalense]|uniref:Uncharacterized protein n=1 Tax=Candidatus Bilamarchaeum dharawalense TaxID=2885759 RepID=A0A5E4LVQ6_9ARCH|nr:Uncharacterised protein [Candidatus Bilamarchaeum dharawalense]